MNEEQLKQKVQGWIVFISSLILIGKFAAYWLTNSVGILTDAMESIVNVLAGPSVCTVSVGLHSPRTKVIRSVMERWSRFRLQWKVF